ncbi:MAG: Short-chain dehydrogenase/reductase SDR?, partial [uncultured Blastococcus sp.]
DSVHSRCRFRRPHHRRDRWLRPRPRREAEGAGGHSRAGRPGQRAESAGGRGPGLPVRRPRRHGQGSQRGSGRADRGRARPPRRRVPQRRHLRGEERRRARHGRVHGGRQHRPLRRRLRRGGRAPGHQARRRRRDGGDRLAGRPLADARRPRVQRGQGRRDRVRPLDGTATGPRGHHDLGHLPWLRRHGDHRRHPRPVHRRQLPGAHRRGGRRWDGHGLDVGRAGCRLRHPARRRRGALHVQGRACRQDGDRRDRRRPGGAAPAVRAL